MLLLVASSIGIAAFYALVSYGLGRNLHGRYLLGMYIVLQAVLWSGLTKGPADGAAARRLILCGALALHAFTLRFVLVSYFD
jgi:ABC-type uncharacterized transport system permease subunit